MRIHKRFSIETGKESEHSVDIRRQIHDSGVQNHGTDRENYRVYDHFGPEIEEHDCRVDFVQHVHAHESVVHAQEGVFGGDAGGFELPFFRFGFHF